MAKIPLPLILFILSIPVYFLQQARANPIPLSFPPT
jgi:hypothetical protein